MKRQLFNLTTAFSLLLCAALCTLWARSYARADILVWTRGDDGKEGTGAFSSLWTEKGTGAFSWLNRP